MKKFILKNENEVVDKINEIIESFWNYKRKEKPIIKIDDVYESKWNEKSFKGNSNFLNAMKKCFDVLGIDMFRIFTLNYEPRFDIAKSRNKGFSYSGRNFLLIAFKELESKHIELTYTTYTLWLN